MSLYSRNNNSFQPMVLWVFIAELVFWVFVVAAVLFVNEFAPHVELHRKDFILLLSALPIATISFLIHLKWKMKAVAALSEEKLAESTFPRLSMGREVWRFIVWRLAIAMIVVGVLGPKVGSKLQEVESQGSDLVIAIDISNSMMAEDLGMDRMSLAKRTVERVLAKLGSDRVGLVIFAGQAYVQCPLTTDYSALKLFLNTISPDLISIQGTALGEAIDVSVLAFKNSPESSRSILLITDGENHEDDPVAAASRARENGIFVHIIGLATPEGAPIPKYDKSGRKVGFIQGADGSPVVSRLDETVLVATATAGDGSFTRAKKSFVNIAPIINALNSAEKTRTSNVRFTDYDHRFQIFLLFALCLVVLESLIPHTTSRK
ncbi:MAG: VWA domain-containing protein [Flavobacteriales bacterium]|jgi:Ca-activated chloride channel homolog|nr:VWA domain-containing protein [Flavobacteriales bacterium]MBT7653048.1 VWA domain-containing protein [Flavobacteriales bacterium]